MSATGETSESCVCRRTMERVQHGFGGATQICCSVVIPVLLFYMTQTRLAASHLNQTVTETFCCSRPPAPKRRRIEFSGSGRLDSSRRQRRGESSKI